MFVYQLRILYYAFGLPQVRKVKKILQQEWTRS